MFSDAKDDGLVDENMFARLGHKKNTGREDITVLTRGEVEQLAALPNVCTAATLASSSPR
jgi:hypothetical protein